ncbi:3529_t:CDS:2 [Funneliformis caledonium]|uniref:3529_t:CDS:1 n=1 Tax=Funneliformis caledonium TaxID=1117310 RepID=A0A9N9I264_9GLOM|nr:3529_t:CDS:2 [Funneliformis caledonium]
MGPKNGHRATELLRSYRLQKPRLDSVENVNIFTVKFNEDLPEEKDSHLDIRVGKRQILSSFVYNAWWNSPSEFIFEFLVRKTGSLQEVESPVLDMSFDFAENSLMPYDLG